MRIVIVRRNLFAKFSHPINKCAHCSYIMERVRNKFPYFLCVLYEVRIRKEEKEIAEELRSCMSCIRQEADLPPYDILVLILRSLCRCATHRT
jgi:hypothetical protein